MWPYFSFGRCGLLKQACYMLLCLTQLETTISFEVSGMWSDPFGFSYEVLLPVSDEVLQHQAASQKLYP